MKQYYSPLRGIAALAAALLFTITSAFAQVNRYGFTTQRGAYTPLTQIDSTLGTSFTDDTPFPNIRLGFQVRFNGNVYSQVNVSANGFIQFGPNPSPFVAGVINAGNGNYWQQGSNQNNQSFAGFNMDLVSQDGGIINIDRAGTAPNRTFTVEWRGYRRFGSDFDGDTLNFQIVVNENGTLETRFGQFNLVTATASSFANVGLLGASFQDVVAINSSDFQNFQRNLTPSGQLNLPPASQPQGLVLRFTPPVPTPIDVEAFQVGLASAGTLPGCVLGNQESIRVTVRNQGTVALDSARLSYRLNNGPVHERQVVFNPAIPPLEFQDVVFSGPEGADLSTFRTYTLSATVARVGDTVGFNNTITSSFTLRAGTRILLRQPVGNFSEDTTAGWRTAGGMHRLNTNVTTNQWRTAFPYPSETVGGYVNAGESDQYSWFYLPGQIVTSAPVAMRFQSSVTILQFGSDPITDIGDDSLVILVSNNCGGAFRRVGSFAQADVASGRINNSLKDFVVPVALQPGTYTIAFYLTTNGTASTTDYRFHLEDIEFIRGTDLLTASLQVPNGRFRGCSHSAQETVSLLVRNQGAGVLTDFTVGYRQGGRIVSHQINIPAGFQPGSDSIFVFSGSEGADLSGALSFNIRGFVRAAQDSVFGNDTLAVDFSSLVNGDPLPGPGITAGSLSEARDLGWRVASGYPAVTSDTNTVVRTAFPYASETIGFYATANQLEPPAWLYRTGYRTTAASAMRFEASVTIDHLGSAPVTDVGDDTLKVLVSTNCGQTWQVATQFTQADLASGRITNILQPYVSPLTQQAATITVAFVLFQGSQDTTANYRWHVENIEFGNPIEAAVTSLTFPTATTNRCAGDLLPVSITLKNNGFGTIDSVTIGVSLNGGPFQTITRPLSLTSDPVTVALPALVMPAAVPARIRAFVSVRGDGVPSNDTVSISVLRPSNITPPTIAFINLIQVTSNGFVAEQSDNGLYLPGGWSTGRAFGSITSLATLMPGRATATGRQTHTLYSPGLNLTPGANSRVTFRAAITRSTFSSIVASTIGDDSLNIMYRLNCGPWQLLRAITQATRDSGNLTNALRNFTLSVPGSANGGELRLAIMATNGSQSPDSLYVWHLTNLQVSGLTAVLSHQAVEALAMAPNPARAQVILTLPEDGAFAVEVFNAQGTVVMAENGHGSHSSLSVQGLPPGFYTVKVRQQGRLMIGRMVRE